MSMTLTKSHTFLITGALAIAFLAPMMVNAETSTPEVKTTSTKERTKRASTTVDRTCMATAVATREASIKSAWTAFTGSVTSALDKRSTALVAAWNASPEGSKDAIKKAWADWKNEKKAAHTKLRSDRKAAWDTFRTTTRSTCKVTAPKEETLEKETKDSISL